jgi:virginiamycin B lyase
MSIRMNHFIAILSFFILLTGCQSRPALSDEPSVETGEVQPTSFQVGTQPTTTLTPSPQQPANGEEAPQMTAPLEEQAVEPTATEEPAGEAPSPGTVEIVEYPVPPGSRPHDVAPAPDGSVWYTAQGSGELGKLDPATGETRHIPLGPGSSPHGVIVGPDGAPWVTDSGLNAIVRVDPLTEEVHTFPLPENARHANLNTAAFDGEGILWFTGQNGYYGRLDPVTGAIDAFQAPRGRGPYGIAATPQGEIYYVSLAGNHLAAVDTASAQVTVLDPPTPDQGARRVWSDSPGRLWISEWNAGQLGRFDPANGEWREWRLPGERPQPYAVYVDDRDQVWLSDFGANAMVRFDPIREIFEVFPLPSSPANVRQILGRPGEVWGAESGVDQLVVLRTIQD